jgi:hypothetical protein
LTATPPQHRLYFFPEPGVVASAVLNDSHPELEPEFGTELFVMAVEICRLRSALAEKS